ncbi:MAG: NADH-quinone oxidoreductase subunit H [Leptospira sp.]|nr:NADH-quinone oxidoreductase subunit H [Leptospira sp.]
MESAIISVYLILLFFILPVFLPGIVRKVRAMAMGRKGPNVELFFYELLRMFRKKTIHPLQFGTFSYIAPILCLFSALVIWSIVLFEWGPYLFIPFFLAMYRITYIGYAMETGTSFGGMGSGRETVLSVMSEPTLILMILVAQSHIEISESLQGFFVGSLFLIMCSIAILSEISKPPFDDPRTHLELTMVHEAMLLEASGKSLFLFEWAAAIKQTSLLVFLVKIALDHSKLIKNAFFSELQRDLLLLPIITLFAFILGYWEAISVRRSWKWIPEMMGLVFLSILILGSLVKLN